jgi:serine protease inhibitor
MIVNRPFVFAICDDHSEVILFLAAVVDPLAG